MRVRAPIEARIQNRQGRVVRVDRNVGHHVVRLPPGRLHVRAAKAKHTVWQFRNVVRDVCERTEQ
jgi:hypothetical protein